MRKLFGIVSGLSFAGSGIASLTGQHWLIVSLFGFVGAVLLILMFVGDEP